jgi:hypothetical protein
MQKIHEKEQQGKEETEKRVLKKEPWEINSKTFKIEVKE